jgi:hypothetical protein
LSEDDGLDLDDGEGVEGLLSEDEDAVSFFLSSPPNSQILTPPIAATVRTPPAIKAIIIPEPPL